MSGNALIAGLTRKILTLYSRLMGKPTALITGASRSVGIGAAIARKLAQTGWNLVVTYWSAYDARMPWGADPNGIAPLKQGLTESGAKVLALEADLESTRAAIDIFKAITREMGPTSALILSHCHWASCGILDTNVESFDRHFAVNVRASWQLIKAFAEQVPESGGRIVALTSDHTVGMVPYGASKGALDRIVLAGARELGHLGITCNVINPGPTETGWIDAETRERLKQRQPNGKMSTPNDIASVVAFILSDEGSQINGQLLRCDRGFSTPR